MRTFIGTSGWSYDHWKGVFYPAGLPKTGWLDYYARAFSTVEVNATFYRRIRESTFEKWRLITPKEFIMAVKADRFITHIRMLKQVEESLRIFLSSVRSLKEKLGPILFQLPPSLAYDPDVLDGFCSIMPSDNRYAIEARHGTWTKDNVLSALKDRNIAWCISDSAGRFPCREAVTADFIYVRLHGPGSLYASDYTDKELESWAQKIVSWGCDAYVYFNNDFSGYALKNAMRLREILAD